jgi:hypothetical protein
LLNPEAYSEYAALVLKNFGYQPSIKQIKPQADALVKLLQMLLEKEAERKRVGET